MKQLIIVFASLGIFAMYSCGNDSKKTEAEPEIVTVDTSKKGPYTAAATEVTFKDPNIAEVYRRYINIKTALVNTDAAQTATEGAYLLAAFTNAGVEEAVLDLTRYVSESKDIEAQREAFPTITETVEGLIDGAIESGVIYKQFCPMAFDFKGAFWLSNSKEIYNPYFGDKMLRCGKVDSKIE